MSNIIVPTPRETLELLLVEAVGHAGGHGWKPTGKMRWSGQTATLWVTLRKGNRYVHAGVRDNAGRTPSEPDFTAWSKDVPRAAFAPTFAAAFEKIARQLFDS